MDRHGYFTYALFPQRGTSRPWAVTQDYNLDRQLLARDPIADPSALVFSTVGAAQLVASA